MSRHVVNLGLLMTALLLALALVDPHIPVNTPADVVVLIDDSDSMADTQVAQTWRRVVGALQARRIGVMHFAGDVSTPIWLTPAAARAAQTPPGAVANGTASTDLAGAVRAALRTLDPQRGGSVVLIGDALATTAQTADALSAAADQAAPLSWAQPESGATQPHIVSLELPADAVVGASLPVWLVVRTTGPAQLDVLADEVSVAQLTLERAGIHRRTVWLEPTREQTQVIARLSENGAVVAQKIAAIAPQTSGQIVVVGKRPRVALLDALRAGGREVQYLPVHLLPPPDDLLPAAIVLDDLAHDSVSEAAYAWLDRSVRADAATLLVLGGASSFTAGGYRDTPLERLLPLVSAPPKRQPAASVIFLIDTSGSMDIVESGARRLDMARAAVLETARTLNETDQVALIAFSDEVQVLSPLRRHSQPADALAAQWRGYAHGGTGLGAALLAAAKMFPDDEQAERLLVVVTDGFATDNLAPVPAVLQQADVALLTLAIGRGGIDTGLDALTNESGGEFFAVTDVVDLPQLMRSSVARYRDGVAHVPTTPEILRPLPAQLRARLPLPQVQRYSLTTAKPAARVTLATAAGEPLLASWRYGTGEVHAMPAGLTDWAPDWTRWPGLADYSDYLLGSGTQHAARGRVDVSLFSTEAGALRLRINMSDGTRWKTQAPEDAVLTDPLGARHRLALETVAPGLFEATMPVSLSGHYRIMTAVSDGPAVARRFHYQAPTELQPTTQMIAARERWLASGLLHRWDSGELPLAAQTEFHTRPLFAVAALVLYLIILVAERRRGLRLWWRGLSNLGPVWVSSATNGGSP